MAVGYLLAFGYAIDIPGKATAFVAYLAFWWPNMPNGARIVSMFGFLFGILGINLLILPKYGAVEFYLTVFKVISIIGIIIAAVAVAAGGGPTALLGTDENYNPVPCALNQIGHCLSPPGFGCN